MIVYVLRLHDKGVRVADEVNDLFAGELNPVAVKAQSKVPLPDGSASLAIHRLLFFRAPCGSRGCK